MIDFATGKEIDINALERMLTYSKEAAMNGRLYMRQFISKHHRNHKNECGTAGCHIGTFLMRETKLPVFELEWDLQVYCDNYALGKGGWGKIDGGFANLSLAEVAFLFTGSCFKSHYQKSESASSLSAQEAIARLEKFIAYKKRKAALLENYEVARKKERR